MKSFSFLLPAAPRPVETCGPVDPVTSEILITLDVSHVGVQIEPGSVEVSLLLRAILRDHRNSAGRIVGYASNTIAATAETPVALNPAEGP